MKNWINEHASDIGFGMFLVVVVSVIIGGVYVVETSVSWSVEQHVETSQERADVERLETQILSRIPGTLAGHDQDWDDAIATAHNIAVRTCCKRRLYEYSGHVATGRMKEIK